MALHWKILIGLVAGVLVGLAINRLWTAQTWQAVGVHDVSAFLKAPPHARRVAEAEGGVNADAAFVADAIRFLRNANTFVGQLFLRLLRFIAVPIVLFSLIAGVASLNDIAKLRRIGARTLVIYMATTCVAVSVGLGLANLIGPGRGFPENTRDLLIAREQASVSAKIASAEARPTPWEVALDMVPENPFAALAQAEMLQVVFAALLVGIGLTLLPRGKAAPVVALCETMTNVVVKIVEMVLVLAPFAVFALIVPVIADLGLDVLGSLGLYVLTVVLGLAIVLFIEYPLWLRVLTPVRYSRFFRAIAPAQLLALSSSSSGATLPVTMECCEKRLGVRDDIVSFVAPLGATINMDGTALYQGVAAVFIAQMLAIDLSVGEQLMIVLTATLASIGTAAVPGVGIVMLVIVLQSVDVPLEGIAVILGVDRILDMCRTVVNISGDSMVCAVVGSAEGALADEQTVLQQLESKRNVGD
ncbi:MAG: dicarboxylate/amino acid:cation symporter [Phycisphaerales bacterium]|nr:dicarboxylate/amino acid:cation symporter [Phycisphaerales bacterium]